MTDHTRTRSYDGPALLRGGFRPFFLGAGLWAFIGLALWVAVFQGGLWVPSAFDVITWHLHEMIFGYLAAAIAGFLLTAIPNWTGRLPLQGLPLALLAALWVIGRIGVGLSEWIGAIAGAVLDLAFLAALLAVVLREILAGRNWRNLPVTAALGGLLAANALFHIEVIGLASTGEIGTRLAIAIFVALISLIGGRIIPSFSRNWLKKQGAIRLPASFGKFDRITLVVLVGALAAWVGAADEPAVGAGLIAAGILSFARLTRWCGHLTLTEPLVWSLHLGFSWLPLGLILTGMATFIDTLSPTAGLHALTIGAMGGMTLAVMTRAILGHSGRALTADRTTSAIYGAIFFAALTRVVAALIDEAAMPLLWASSITWLAAFGMFTAHYGRMLVQR